MKDALVQQLLGILEAELLALKASTEVAASAATHEESKPENKYDTRGLEASYLAGAQASRVAELQAGIAQLRAMKLVVFLGEMPIAASAVVEVAQGDEAAFYFVVPVGAGFQLVSGDKQILSITTTSPLGRKLLGKGVGEDFTLTTPHGIKTFEIVSVY